MLNNDDRSALREAVELFNAGEYFECHEVLETPWRHAAEPDRTFLKGLIHGAVALYQYRRGNSHGARVKGASCQRYLAPFRPAHEGLDIEALLTELAGFLAPLTGLPKGAPLPATVTPWPMVRRVGGGAAERAHGEG